MAIRSRGAIRTHRCGKTRRTNKSIPACLAALILGCLLPTAQAGPGRQDHSAESSLRPDSTPAVPSSAVSSSTATAEAEADELSPEELTEIEQATGADAATMAAEQNEASSGEGLAGILGGPTVAALLPDIAVILDVALAVFTDEQPLQTGGHDPQKTGFNLQQLELSLRKSVDPYFRFDANIVFSLFGVELEEAYATTLSLPFNLQVRAGQMLTRFGRLNSTHPHSWEFVDQPFMLGKIFGGEGNRGLGVELSYLTPLPWYVEIIGSTTDATGESTARSFYGANDGGIDSPLDFQNTLAIKQFFELSANWSLLWGLSVANGPNPHGRDTRSDVYGTDLYLKYRPITRASYTIVSLQTEWLYRRRQVPGLVLQDTGGYAQLWWRFAQRWATAGRYEYGTPTYDSSGNIAVDPLDPAQDSERHRASLNVTFWPTEFSRLRLQGSSDFPAWRPKPILATFLALEVVVGSHGAHKF